MEEKIYSVTELNNEVKFFIEKSEQFSDICLIGEVLSFVQNAKSKHMYFTLKDEKSSIKATIFYPKTNFIKFDIEDGAVIKVYGKVTLYANAGQYQINVDRVEEVSDLGILSKELILLKEKLEKEGLFDSRKKSKVPRNSKNIAVITSSTGAVIQDIKNVITRRNKATKIVLAAVSVQGNSASKDIIKAIKRVNKLKNIDVIILARGGGSKEDLMVFNDESLVRAVAKSKIPIISAIGHETDTTLCDFAASLRVPTPSAAAELAVLDIKELLLRLEKAKESSKQSLKKMLEYHKFRLNLVSKDKIKLKLYKKLEFDKLKFARVNSHAIKRMIKSSLCDKIDNFLQLKDSIKSPINLCDFYQDKLEKIKQKTKADATKILIESKEKYKDINFPLIKMKINLIKDKKQDLLNQKIDKINKKFELDFDAKKDNFAKILDKLDLLNPINTLKKGYTSCSKNGKLITQFTDININDDIDLRFYDFSAKCKILEKSKVSKNGKK